MSKDLLQSILMAGQGIMPWLKLDIHEVQNSLVKDGNEEILLNAHRIASLLNKVVA